MFARMMTTTTIFLLSIPKEELFLAVNLAWITVYWLIGLLVIYGLGFAEPKTSRGQFALAFRINDIIGLVGIVCVFASWLCGN